MKNNKWMVRIILFLLIQAIVIFLSIVLRNIVLLVANNWFDESLSRYWVSSGISILAFVSLQFYMGKVVQTQKKDRSEMNEFKFAFRETIPFFVFLLPCLLVTLVTGRIDMFESFIGRMYAPYLAFNLWNHFSLGAYFLYTALEFVIVLCITKIYNKKDKNSSGGTENHQ